MSDTTHLSSGLTAIVIGGGIGGLASAVALHQVGIKPTVFEKAPELREVGAGLSLWPNAMQALDLLGLAQRVGAVGALLQLGETRSWNGRVLRTLDIRSISEQLGFPAICVHRADLHRVLLEALPNGTIHLGFQCVGFRQDDNGVTAHFDNGEEARADLLVGADGLHSIVRAQLHGKLPPRYAGYTAWRGIAYPDYPLVREGESFESWGPGQRFGLIPIGRERLYWFATKNAVEGAGDTITNHQQEVLQNFSGWHEPVEYVVEATQPEAILRNAVYDRSPLKPWGEGKVTLLGDAAIRLLLI